MMLYRQNITVIYLLLISLGLFSCNTDTVPESSTYTYVSISLTKSAQSDENIDNINETRVRHVRVFVFEGEILETTFDKEFRDGTSGNDNILGYPGVTINFDPIKVRVGNKKVYAVINEPNTEAAQKLLEDVKAPGDLDSLVYQLTDIEKPGQGIAYCLPMFAEQTNIRVTHSSQENPITLELKATRALARVDIIVRKKEDIYNIDIIPSSSFSTKNLLSKGYYSPMIIAISKGTDTPSIGVALRPRSISTKFELLYSFYTPEVDCSAAAGKLGFSIANVENSGIKTDYSATIGADGNIVNGVQNTVLTKLERNCVYKIKCTFSEKTLTIERIDSTIKDWEFGGELD